MAELVLVNDDGGMVFDAETSLKSSTSRTDPLYFSHPLVAVARVPYRNPSDNTNARPFLFTDAQVIVVRAARAAKLGARAGRLSRAGRLERRQRWLSFLQARTRWFS